MTGGGVKSAKSSPALGRRGGWGVNHHQRITFRVIRQKLTRSQFFLKTLSVMGPFYFTVMTFNEIVLLTSKKLNAVIFSSLKLFSSR